MTTKTDTIKNLDEAALRLSLEEYRLYWYRQLGERPPELAEELTVGQARDERLIREGYEHRRKRARI